MQALRHNIECANASSCVYFVCAVRQVDLPVEKGVVLLDVAFTGTDPNHGEWT
jgi:hypothetical protein